MTPKQMLDMLCDPITRALKTIEYQHHEVHGGSTFAVNDVQNIDSTTVKWLVTVPDTAKYPHMIFDFNSTGEMLVKITEGADRVGSNLLTSINRNRNSTGVAGVTVHRAITGGSTDGDAVIMHSRSGSTGVNGKTESGGGDRSLNEYILKRNTKYLITVTTYANIYVTARFDWYEHTDKGQI